jgi:hypothetical protein
MQALKQQVPALYIDGNIVLDANRPCLMMLAILILVSLLEITILPKKDGHEFTYNGRFRSIRITKEFLKIQTKQLCFVDNTRVTVIGKVVGGSVEAAKDAGLERMALKRYQ